MLTEVDSADQSRIRNSALILNSAFDGDFAVTSPCMIEDGTSTTGLCRWPVLTKPEPM